MDNFVTQLRARISHPVLLVISLISLLMLTVSGPFGTYDNMEFFARLEYWGAVVLFSIFVSYSVWGLVDIILDGFNYWLKSLAIACGSATILAPGVLILTGWMIDESLGTPPPAVVVASISFSISMFVSFIRYFYVEEFQPDKPRLFNRLDDQNARELTRITVRDHYVDVYTDRGKESLLMRFSDALEELEGWPGVQVHRSHWVAISAVQKLQKQNGRSKIILTDGSEIPVSRGYLPMAEDKFG